MNHIKLYFALSLAVFLAACSFGQNTIDANKVRKIKNIAVIMYTVPQQIAYKDNARNNTYADIADGVIGLNGTKAANAAIRTFTDTLQTQGLPFKVMPHSNVISNAKFVALYKPTIIIKKKEDGSLLGQALSFLSSANDKPDMTGAAPSKMNQYDLTVWAGNTALTGKPDESNYIIKAIEALKVDAVLLINDPGFSFSCEACIGFAGAMNGAASTGSAFNATLVSRSGPVMNIREWFATTDEQAAMALGIVNPAAHQALFEEHGRRMAQVFAEAVKDSMTN